MEYYYLIVYPHLPFAIMNVVLSIGKTDLTKFIICSFIGMLHAPSLTIWMRTQASAFRNLIEDDTENPYIPFGHIDC